MIRESKAGDGIVADHLTLLGQLERTYLGTIEMEQSL